MVQPGRCLPEGHDGEKPAGADEEETVDEEMAEGEVDEDVDEPAKPAKKVALPARGAVLAKAKAKGKAKAKAKAKAAAAKPKAKAKAGPARGVIKAAMKADPKAKPKAIAAKEFADVAAKLKKTKSKETVAGEGQWYFMSDLRKMKAGVDDANAWTKYDAKMNKQLETAYSKGFKQYTMSFKGKQYIVKFSSMMQFRADDKSLQRPVKRE